LSLFGRIVDMVLTTAVVSCLYWGRSETRSEHFDNSNPNAVWFE